MKIIPTVFATSKKQFKERFHKLLPISHNLQIDFMDGKFVPSKSISLSQIPNLKHYKNSFSAHLMVSHPEKYFKKLKQKGFKKIIFHIEATKEPEKLIFRIKKLKMRPMVAINPRTDLNKLQSKIPVLFLGVNPGKEHQSFVPSVYNKISSFRKKNKRATIQVDGGVSPKNIRKLAKLGVNAVNSGSYISEAENPRKAFNKLRDLSKK
jgi:ribulose-phosphate 3-epimerase